jgi:DNA invertase Pin-like site-specific DNA recombinase
LYCRVGGRGELLVTVLAGFATFERHLIKARTDEGRKPAKARGVRFGQARKLDPHQRQEALQRLANGEALVDVARTYAVDPTTIGRLLYNGA